MKINIIHSSVLAAAFLLPFSSVTEGAGKFDDFVPLEHAVDVFTGGSNIPLPNVRIPTIINADGLIVAAAEGRHGAHDQAQNEIVVSVSKDYGKHWSKPVIAAADPAHGTYNNPCILYDKSKKQIILFFQNYPPGTSERGKMEAGTKGEKTLHNYISFSKNGKRWSKPKDITPSTKHEDATITCSGPNPGIQLTRGKHKGRLVVVMNEAVKFGDWNLTAAFSDDGGKTWKLGEKSDKGHQINETSWVETDEGNVLAVARSYPGAGTRRIATSEDGGATWGEVSSHAELPCTGCQNGLTRYSFKSDKDRGGKSRILFSAPSKGRTTGIIKMSYDDGQTWPVAKSLGDGNFAYSAICPLEPGYIGLIYEPNDAKTIRFIRIPVEWLTDGKDSGTSGKNNSASDGDTTP